MKFLIEKCSCGLDLTTATPVKVMQMPAATLGQCPNCWRVHVMVEEEAEVIPTPEPTPAPTASRRRRVSGPEPAVEPPTEPGAETEPPPEE